MAGLYKDLQDKNVLVTGGASGLGYAIAEVFVANHSNVVIVGRNEEKLKSAQNALGGKVACIAFDLNEIDRLSELMAQIKDSVGEIDVLVNKSSVIPPPSPRSRA